MPVIDFIEAFVNACRRDSAHGYVRPVRWSTSSRSSRPSHSPVREDARPLQPPLESSG